MTSKWVYTTAAVALAFLIFGSQTAAGFNGYGKPGQPRAACPQMSGYWASELDLTETQINQFKAMNERFASQNNELRDRLYSMHQEMRQMWADPNADPARVIAKQEEINELKNKLRINVTEHRMRMRNEVLTSEQREKLSTMLQNRGDRRGYHDGRRGFRDRPGRMDW